MLLLLSIVAGVTECEADMIGAAWVRTLIVVEHWVVEHWEAEGRGTVCRLLIGLGLTVLTPRDRVGDCGVRNTHGAVSSPEGVGTKDNKERNHLMVS